MFLQRRGRETMRNSAGLYVTNLKIQPAPVAGKVSNVVLSIEGLPENVSDDRIVSVQWFNGTGILVSKKRMYVPLVDEVGESLRVEVSVNGGKSSFCAFSSPVLPHQKLAANVFDIFKKRKDISFDTVVRGKGWGKREEDTERLSIVLTKKKVKLRQNNKTTIKETHVGKVMAFSDRTSSSTLHVRMHDHR